MFTILIVIIGLAFAVYAIVNHYNSTDPTKSVPSRVWASVSLAVAALAAAAANWWTGILQ